MTRRPISFIATAQPDAAAAFYGTVLGLELVEQSPFALVFKDGDAMLRVQIVQELSVTAYTVHGWEVFDIDAEIAKLSLNGVSFLIFDGMSQTASGVWTTPSGDKIAWFKDPDGNVLSLTEFSLS